MTTEECTFSIIHFKYLVEQVLSRLIMKYVNNAFGKFYQTFSKHIYPVFKSAVPVTDFLCTDLRV